MNPTPRAFRVLFVNSLRKWGGGEIWMLRTASALRERGHETLIVGRTGGRLAAEAERAGQPFLARPFRGDLDPAGVAAMAGLFRRFRPDVVIPNLDKEVKLCALASRLAGRPPVVPRRGNEFPLKDRARYRLLYKHLVRKVVVNCDATRRTLLDHAPWLPADRIVVIPNGVEMERFAGPESDPSGARAAALTELRAELELPAGAPVVGMVAELNERKGHVYLLRAAPRILERHPETRFLLVGEGDARAELEAAAARVGLRGRFRFLGRRDDVPDLLQPMDVVVLPSLNEGMPNALMEAMAAGRAVVATNVSGTPELVLDGETGLLVPPRDADALAAAVLRVLDDAALRRRFGEAGRARVAAAFRFERMLERYEALFAEVAP